MTLKITNNEIRLTATQDTSACGTLSYEEKKDVICINSIHVVDKLRGQGVAGQLMEEMVKLAEIKEKSLQPICPYAATWLEKISNKE